MPCDERARLHSELSEARARHKVARQTLDSKIGVSSRDEFLSLSEAIDHTSTALDRAQYMLDRHTEEHGCQPIGDPPVETSAEG
jgi:hypothetical protein